jgi:capsular polysaccharide transport system permease protein
MQKLSFLRWRMFWIVVVVPNIVSLIYFGFIASPVYVSNASVLVFKPAQSSVNLSALMAGGSGGESFEGAYILEKYIGSWAEYQRVSGSIDLAAHYSQGDFVSRYGGVATLFRRNEIALWQLYQRRVDVEVNEKNNIVTVQFKGYTPEFSSRLGQQVLQDAIEHIDTMNQQMERDYVANAEKSRETIESNLERDEGALAEYRARIGVLDPDSQYTAQLNLLTSLEQSKANLQSQQRALASATPNNPAAQNMSRGIAALDAKIDSIQSAFKTLAAENARYQALVMARDNDAALLKQVDVAAQEAKLNSIKSKYYLQVISPVSEPHSPEQPKRLEWIAGIFAGTLLLWSLIR